MRRDHRLREKSGVVVAAGVVLAVFIGWALFSRRLTSYFDLKKSVG